MNENAFKILRRKELEEREHLILSPLATKADESRGRLNPEKPCEYRTCFQRDRDRIIHSKAFRRLMHKTQVFIASELDHYRTRLTHTLEVSQVSRTIARALNLNEDLTEAIALGHDLGHTPFGHNGEEVLDTQLKEHGLSFKHSIQSLRVVDVLESRNGSMRGLNLTFEVRDGITNHSGKSEVATPEASVVQLSDRIAYLNHDIDDALRSGKLKIHDIPKEYLEIFGYTHGARIETMITNVVENSVGKERVSLDEFHQKALLRLRQFMFATIYHNESVKPQETMDTVERIVGGLFHFYCNNSHLLPLEFQQVINEDGPLIATKDYVAGMTDRFATKIFEKLKEEYPLEMKEAISRIISQKEA